MIYLVLFFSLFSHPQIVPDIVISTQSIAEKRIYNPLKYRNPMVRPTATSPTTLNYSYTVFKTTDTSFDMERVVLEGIMSSPSFKEALLRDTSTGEIYIVRDSRIYTKSRKLIEGYIVDIVGKGVVIYQKKTGKRKELIISEGGERI